MKHGIVEGEPGIFPAPIARFLRAVGRVFGHRSSEPDPPDQQDDDAPDETAP